MAPTAPPPVKVKAPEVSWNPSEPWLSTRLVKWERGVPMLSDRRGDFAPIEGAGSITWTRDGTAYFTGRPDNNLRRCVVATSECRTISMPKWREYALSPDGKRIMATPNDEKQPAHIVDVATGARQIVPAREGTWLDDDRIVYIPYTGAQQLTVWNVRAQTATSLGPTASVPNITHLTPSPDGKWIAYVGRKVRERANGSRSSRYGVGVFDVVKQTWATYFDGSEDVAPNFAPGGEAPHWSADSRRLAFVANGIVTISLPSLKVQAAPDGPVWSLLGWVDAHRVAYLRLSRSDNSQVVRFGHGVVDVWCDGYVRDLDGNDDVALTTDNALTQCAAALVPRSR